MPKSLRVLASLAFGLTALAACGQPGPQEPLAAVPTGESAAETPTPPAPPEPTLPTAADAATPTAAPLRSMGVEVAFPNVDLPRMVVLTHAGDGAGLLYLALQQGLVMVFDPDGDAEPTEFLDIRDRVNATGNEEGLLGLAFGPEYATSGRFYVSYTASGPRRSVVSSFAARGGDSGLADPASERLILEALQPYPNHNGGNIAFGPDGFLYIGLGDGGAGGDPLGNGQDPGTMLGAILRIDPSAADDARGYTIPPGNPFVGDPGARNEVWAYGLRNPWRFSFDRATGDLWAGDVGQNAYEEIDLIVPGGNYGWNVAEGSHCYPPSRSACDRSDMLPPVVEYPLERGTCSVTGGYVYRGSRLPALAGVYVYADFCGGQVWALRFDGREVAERALVADTGLQIPSFGEGPDGELYILAFDGRVYRLTSPD